MSNNMHNSSNQLLNSIMQNPQHNSRSNYSDVIQSMSSDSEGDNLSKIALRGEIEGGIMGNKLLKSIMDERSQVDYAIAKYQNQEIKTQQTKLANKQFFQNNVGMLDDITRARNAGDVATITSQMFKLMNDYRKIPDNPYSNSELIDIRPNELQYVFKDRETGVEMRIGVKDLINQGASLTIEDPMQRSFALQPFDENHREQYQNYKDIQNLSKEKVRSEIAENYSKANIHNAQAQIGMSGNKLSDIDKMRFETNLKRQEKILEERNKKIEHKEVTYSALSAPINFLSDESLNIKDLYASSPSQIYSSIANSLGLEKNNPAIIRDFLQQQFNQAKALQNKNLAVRNEAEFEKIAHVDTDINSPKSMVAILAFAGVQSATNPEQLEKIKSMLGKFRSSKDAKYWDGIIKSLDLDKVQEKLQHEMDARDINPHYIEPEKNVLTGQWVDINGEEHHTFKEAKQASDRKIKYYKSSQGNNDVYNDGTLPQDSLIQGMQNAVGQQNGRQNDLDAKKARYYRKSYDNKI